MIAARRLGGVADGSERKALIVKVSAALAALVDDVRVPPFADKVVGCSSLAVHRRLVLGLDPQSGVLRDAVMQVGCIEDVDGHLIFNG